MKSIKTIIVLFVLAVIVWIGWVAYSDLDSLVGAIKKIGWQGFVFLGSISLINYILRYQRWRYFLAVQGAPSASWFDGLLCYVAGFALMVSPGKVGEAVRALFFKERHDVPVTMSLSALFGERLTDLMVAVIIGAAGFYVFEEFWWLPIVTVFACATLIFLLLHPAWILWGINQIGTILPAGLKKLLDQLPVLLSQARQLVTLRCLIIAVIMALVAWSAESLGFAWLALRLGVEQNIILLSSVFAMSLLVGAVMPGGVGGVEAAMALLLTMLGAEPAAIVVICLVSRLVTMWLAMALGAVSLFYLLSGESLSKKLQGLSYG